MSIQSEDLLGSGRKRTDKSLRAERDKTDESMSSIRRETERRTDEDVSSSRSAADEARSQSRLESDQSVDSERARLDQERRAADDALQRERRLTDGLLLRERGNTRVVERALLSHERLETDRDLAQERSETDEEVRRSAVALSDERSAHVVTRASLTTRDELLAIVSHDLRNPLGSILMAANLLVEKDPKQVSPEERQLIELIVRNADEALRLIGDLIDMERMARGKLGIRLEPRDLVEVAREAVETFHQAADAKGIAITLAPSEDRIVALCDRDRVTQVLSNLVGNALKFTPGGGKIVVRVTSSHDEAELCVVDDGPGIPADQQETIFERFSQLKKADRRGLGLGLYISKAIVEAHGGRIWVVSAPGRGSSFHVTLPR